MQPGHGGALYHFGTSGAAVAAATAVTHPLALGSVRYSSSSVGLGNGSKEIGLQNWGADDSGLVSSIRYVIKVRLQMQLAGQRGNLVGMGTIFTQMVQVEGPRSLYLGLAPALTRSVIYGGLRLGLYEPCKYVCNYAFGSTNFAFKFASGVIAGALATALTNPTEVLKVRSQMSPSRTSTIGVLKKIVAEEGVKALWKGVGPAMARAGCLTASQMATYDEAKQRECKGARVYRNGFHCGYQVVVTEGVTSLYKGGFATFARLGPQTAITFVVCEKLRELAGMTAI
ncbi:hypothetical protein OsI_38579 [Oryza sativa Indica Group]|nr:hypothetical protein OsI_38579 [Oryza sativa Indica Group]